MALNINHIKATGLELSEDVKAYAEEKIDSLEKFIGDEPVTCDVEVEKVTDSQKGDIYRVEVNLQVKGLLHRVEETTDQIEKSIDRVRDELQKKLRRANKKEQTLVKKGGAALKRMMRFGR